MLYNRYKSVQSQYFNFFYLEDSIIMQSKFNKLWFCNFNISRVNFAGGGNQYPKTEPIIFVLNINKKCQNYQIFLLSPEINVCPIFSDFDFFSDQRTDTCV